MSETPRASTPRMPTAFIPHGGGPWPVLPMPSMMDAGETEALAAYMRSISATPPQRPRALLVVSAHWEAPTLSVNTNAAPGMYYDYGGFPPEAYTLSWPAPGDPALAEQVRARLREAGFETRSDDARGYDHGTFVPLMLAYPEADIPVVQLSLRAGLDAAEHLAIGAALAPLRERGVYIIGSGNSFHNLSAMLQRRRALIPVSEAFDAWLAAAVSAPRPEREAQLARWTEAPGALDCHPRAEHLIPLMVCAGAAGADPGRVAWSGRAFGFPVSAHCFG